MTNDAPPSPAGRQPLMGLAALMTMAYADRDLAPISQRLVQRSTADPHDANALMDMAVLLQFKGDRQLALAVQAQALQVRRLYHLPSARQPPGIRLLALMAPGDLMANTPLEFLVEDSDIALDLLYLSPDPPLPADLPANLPEHDVAFVAVSQSEQNRPVLELVEKLLPHWPRPVLNTPDRIARLRRDTACQILQSIPSLVMPIFVRVNRRTLTDLAVGDQSLTDLLDDGAFPLIVRPLDSHAGRGLARLDQPRDITDYLHNNSDGEFYLAPYLDYRSADGLFRKYRIVWIDSSPFACHMGVSDNWMIHYLNAGMEDSSLKRDEEARFMANFDSDFARRHRDALHEINRRLGLDYLGIDCAQTPDGRLLIFEVHSSMVVHSMDSAHRFPYKKPQMRKIFNAFRAMLQRAAAPQSSRNT